MKGNRLQSIELKMKTRLVFTSALRASSERFSMLTSASF